jgi:hypothetical protein
VNGVESRRRELEDAKAVLARYHRMCLWLLVGFFISLAGFLACGLMMWLGADADSGVWFLGVPALAGIVVFGAGFAVVVADAHDTGRSGTELHPADPVRKAQRAYDDALNDAAEQINANYIAAKRAAADTPLEDLP